MFEAYRCETCHYGRYSLLNNEWECLVGILETGDEDECAENYQDSEES